MLIDRLIQQAQAQPDLPALRAIGRWLPDARRLILSSADLARIDAYAGDAEALHDMLPAVLPLAGPVWYEARIVAQHGTHMVLGYGATAAGPGQIDVWCAFAALGADRILGPCGPLRLDAQGIDPQADDAAPATRELRAAAGIVLRALTMGLGRPA